MKYKKSNFIDYNLVRALYSLRHDFWSLYGRKVAMFIHQPLPDKRGDVKYSMRKYNGLICHLLSRDRRWREKVRARWESAMSSPPSLDVIHFFSSARQTDEGEDVSCSPQGGLYCARLRTNWNIIRTTQLRPRLSHKQARQSRLRSRAL